MISFALLSPLARALFALWALLLCLTNIGSASIAAVKKRYKLTVLAFLLFVPVYTMWQVIFDLSLFKGTPDIAAATETLCNIPWLIWFAAFAVLSVCAGLLLGYNIKYDRTNLNSGTIKLYLDKMPCGICCWRENGRVLFSNICMNDLCVAITQKQLLNGNHFHDAIKDDIISVDDKVWRFVSRKITVDGEQIYEMVASDITNEYAKTQALESDKAELSRLNNELREYYLSIDDSVKRQEILQAKMSIHDEMNRLMLSTAAADKEDSKALDNIFSLWEQNALLLCLDAENKSNQHQTAAVESLAAALGISVIWNSALPEELSEKQKELFFFTLQEAIINAVKHAGAKQMDISFKETDEEIICRFKNDGSIPQREVKFEGGLANLARLASEQDAELNVEIGEEFSLLLKILKNHTFG